jgi:glycosyltransferase involved in cell wall biosynthesis
MTVDIVCAVHNGERFFPELLESIVRQTLSDWTLWLYDDHSTDGSAALLRQATAADARIRLLESAGANLGATASFARLLSNVPAHASYVMFADQDDVWQPDKIERTLAAMHAAESRESPDTPVLVHTDLTVVDEHLRVIHPSFWEYAGIDPDGTVLRRIIVRNVATGAATMMNRALRKLADPIPPEAVLHDWWIACAAAAFGRIVAVREPTILYRQHGGNVVGARAWGISARNLPRAILRALENTSTVRDGIERTAAQSRAFLARHEQRFSDSDRRFLADYGAIPERGFWRRKRDLLRLRMLPEYGMLRRLGILLRG